MATKKELDVVARILCRESCPASHCSPCSPGSRQYELARTVLEAAEAQRKGDSP
jgi:hypothetical protein